MKLHFAHLSLAALLDPSLGAHGWAGPRLALNLDPHGNSSVMNERVLVEAGAQQKAMARTKARYTTEHFISERDVLDAQTPSSGTRHPFWHFEGFQLQKFQVYICCVVLFLAGVLCAAGGIGGGGIYVTVLMVAGAMKVSDAVPLSKSVVFCGSVSSLILNMRKSAGSGDEPAKSLIDYNICRLVVPGALLGTFLGVFLNRHLPGWLLLLVLVSVLLFISYSVFMKTWSQYREECASDAAAAAAGAAGGADEESASRSAAQEEAGRPAVPQAGRPAVPQAGRPAEAAPAEQAGQAAVKVPEAAEENQEPAKSSLRTTLRGTDICVSFVMLVVVIVFGMLRFHAGECMRAEPALQEEACNHPAYFWLGHGTMQRWMSTPAGEELMRGFSFLFPLCVCALVLSYYTWLVVAHEGVRFVETLQYSVMAICTGCLAGLVGIGGGLIFSPFFLLMGVEPSVAVATSSTCVIFTSSSTTMQYLLTDRIIISLTVVYGIINLIASYVGTSLVHAMQDKFAARKSYISLIVLLGVVISTVLSIIKLVTKLSEHFGPAGNTHPLGAH